MTDIPRRTAARTAKLASLPLGVAGRAAAGWGRRLAGGNGDESPRRCWPSNAEQLFAVLGELKGGAMKFGQALSVFEAAIPDEFAAPFRESLVKLQTAAPPMSSADVHWVLAEQFGRGWRTRFREFEELPAAAASIGQVHRAVWRDGREVAVKLQYPGRRAGAALRPAQLSRMSRVLRHWSRAGRQAADRGAARTDGEELDYRDEAASQRTFAAAFEGDEQVAVPRVVASAPRCSSPSGSVAAAVGRDPGGQPGGAGRGRRPLAEFHYSSPARVGLLHADPHPGNFQLLPDGRLM